MFNGLKIICFQEQLEQPLQKYYKVVKVGTYILRGYLSVNMITTFLEVYALHGWLYEHSIVLILLI